MFNANIKKYRSLVHLFIFCVYFEYLLCSRCFHLCKYRDRHTTCDGTGKVAGGRDGFCVCVTGVCVRGGCARTIQRWDGVRCAQGPGTWGREAGSSVLRVVKLEEGVQTNELWKETIKLYFSGIFLAVYITEYLTVA